MPIHGKEPPWGKTRHLFANNGVGTWNPQKRAWIKVNGVWEQVFGTGTTVGQTALMHFDETWDTNSSGYGTIVGVSAGESTPPLEPNDGFFGGSSLNVTPYYDGMQFLVRGISITGGSNILDFETGDFTFDFRVKFNDVPPDGTGIIALNEYNIFIDGFPVGYSAWPRFIYLPPYSGKPSRLSSLENVGADGGPHSFEWTPAPVLNQWYHLALVRYNGTVTHYVDGADMGSYSCSDQLIFGTNGGGSPSGEYISVGAQYGWSPGIHQVGLWGRLCEFRMLNGIAAWQGPFIPPTSPYWSGP